ARYLLELNAALRRSVSSRWARAHGRWSTSDGLIQVAPGTTAALARHRLRSRPYSLSALQRYATCPYQFLLGAIHRVQAWDEPQAVVRMDPLTRGSLFHSAQAQFFRALQASGALPVTTATLPAAIHTLHAALDEVAAVYAERLAPAIERVWDDEIDEIRRDLRIWVERLAADTTWTPEYFEFSFGLNDTGRDPRSLPEPVTLDSGFQLRGSVDLIERRRDGTGLRVTDHKTGKNRSTPQLLVGGGTVLQPVLYSLAVEQGLGEPVEVGRLSYCTTAGGFAVHPIPIDGEARARGLEVLAIIDRAIELGRLPAAPMPDACRWCDYRRVCGPDEARRVANKPGALLADLDALRAMP
ncbi:MAG: PD-(D/E)XK nuclease family protein, partial [Acidobacteriota bacterium]